MPRPRCRSARAVHPDRRKGGLGRLPRAEAKQRLREQGCPKVTLQIPSDSRSAVQFYRRPGDAVDDVVSMGRRLEDDSSPAAPGVNVALGGNGPTLGGFGASVGETRSHPARIGAGRPSDAPNRASGDPATPKRPCGRAKAPERPGWGTDYAASGVTRAFARAVARRARMVRSTCRRTRSIRRTRKGRIDHSCLR
jgi:hypothetical protein